MFSFFCWFESISFWLLPLLYCLVLLVSFFPVGKVFLVHTLIVTETFKVFFYLLHIIFLACSFPFWQNFYHCFVFHILLLHCVHLCRVVCLISCYLLHCCFAIVFHVFYVFGILWNFIHCCCSLGTFYVFFLYVFAFFNLL